MGNLWSNHIIMIRTSIYHQEWFRKTIFIVLLIICITPWVNPPVALLIGLFVAQTFGNPYQQLNHKVTSMLLKLSVVGLGFGMTIQTAMNAGRQGFAFTIGSIAITLTAGFILGKILKINQKISYLISAGTAICGGSAIAAIAPVIKAKEKQISVALGTIFILNSVALFLFPFIGHQLNLSQSQFGIWSAIAIQDTSSVVGAASRFGSEALQIATTVKLTRALWIIPIAFASSWIFKSKDTKVKIPYFIGFFVVAIVLHSYFPFPDLINTAIISASKTGLTITLFLIGSGLSRKILGTVGFKPILQGVILWAIISVIGLWSVLSFV